MAEVLHTSHGAGVQGPMLSAPPAQHPGLRPPPPAPSPAWLGPGADPLQGFPVDGGIRHRQSEPFAGAAAAAAEALGDDLIGAQRRHLPTGIAAPYQKAAAQRSAEKAIRPWEPVSGLGERRGAPELQVPGANAGVQAFAAPDAPSLFVAPTAAQVEAVATAAGRVARGGQGQPGAEGAFSAKDGVRPGRELWPVKLLNQPPKYCTACRGEHDQAKVGTTEWQPYTPGNRLANLQLIDTRFRAAMKKGLLCCKLSDAPWQPVRWSVQPQAMSRDQFRQQLTLAFDGVREGHEPFRFLATRAVEDLLAGAGTQRQTAAEGEQGPSSNSPRQQQQQGGDGSGGSSSGSGSRVADAVPDLVAPIKLCLNTMQPQLVGGLLILLIRLLRSHPSVPLALAPYSRHLLPTLAVFRSHRKAMWLPAAVCLPPTGSFSGSGAPRGNVSRSCRVCGAPLFGDHARASAREAAEVEPDPAAAAEAAAAVGMQRLPGRFCRRYTLEALVEEVLGLLAGGGGDVGRRLVQNYIPTFDYYPPQNQPACVTMEELLESQAPRRRPGSAPRPAAHRSAAGRPASAAGRPASAAAGRGRRTKGAVVVDDAKELPPPSAYGLSAADMARWDGIEFRDEPYGVAVRREQQQAADLLELGGGGSGGSKAAALRISTPVPIFDSPHDPLYRALRQHFDAAPAGVAAGKVQFALDGGRGGGGGRTRAANRRRGGSGGGAPGANVNAEVPYKEAPARIRRAL